MNKASTLQFMSSQGTKLSLGSEEVLMGLILQLRQPSLSAKSTYQILIDKNHLHKCDEVSNGLHVANF